MAETSDAVVVAALAAVVRDHGWEPAGQPGRLKAMLSDALGAAATEHRAALEALVVSAEEGVAEAVRVAGASADEQSLAELRHRLEEWGLDTAWAAWAVATWRSLVPERTAQVPVTSPPSDTGADLAATVLPPVLPTILPPAPGPLSTPTELPAHPEAVPASGPSGPSDVTPAPPPEPASEPASEPDSDPELETGSSPMPHRRAGRWMAVGGGLLLVTGGLAAASLLRQGDDDPAGASGRATPSAAPSTDPSAAAVPVAAGTELVASDGEGVRAAPATYAMAWRTAGVRITALGPVDELGTGADRRTAPSGGSLIGFTLADWPCAIRPCGPWAKAGVHVQVDGASRPLPSGSTSYVVAVPAGAKAVDLVGKQGGIEQRLSLLDGSPAAGNVAVLGREKRRFDIGRTVRLTERTDHALDFGNGLTTRDELVVKVRTAELGFFMQGKRPGSTQRAFLFVDVRYTRGSDPRPQGLNTRATTLLDSSGKAYRRVDVGRTTSVFEVPADITSATLRLGGTFPATACRTNDRDVCDLRYTATLETRQVRLDLR